MKSDSDMRPEYDFSGGVRARYAARFTESERAELLQRSAALDGHYWFGHTLQRVQELEAMVVAFLTLALNRSPQTAGTETAALFEGRDMALLTGLSLAVGRPNGSELEARFRKVMSERSWLVHKGGFAVALEQNDPEMIAAAVRRLEATAQAADELARSLRANLEVHLARSGLSSEEAQKRTDEVIHRWLAA